MIVKGGLISSACMIIILRNIQYISVHTVTCNIYKLTIKDRDTGLTLAKKYTNLTLFDLRLVGVAKMKEEGQGCPLFAGLSGVGGESGRGTDWA